MSRMNTEKPIHNHVELPIGFIEVSKIPLSGAKCQVAWWVSDFSACSGCQVAGARCREDKSTTDRKIHNDCAHPPTCPLLPISPPPRLLQSHARSFTIRHSSERYQIMLKQFARLERTRKSIIVGFAILMAVSLIVFYGPGRSARSLEPTRNTEVVANVGGDEIKVSDVAFQKESIRARYGGQISLAQLGLTNDRVLDGLVRQKIIRQEAMRLGLFPSEADVANEIRKQFRDPATGQYVSIDPDKDPARYRERATAMAGDLERFEEQFRDQLAYRNLRAFVTLSVSVSDDEVQENYKRDTTTISLSYVFLSPEKLAEKIQVSDDELRKLLRAAQH